MLLSCFLLKIQHFKTSYVIVYHKYHFLVYMHLLYFKTSYVIVYLSGVMNLAAASGFQNILCYCLSVAKSVHEPPFLKFQNILCYCLSYIRFIQKELIYISKHLMLLFIFKASCNSQHFSAFQNILCYCLSSFSSRPLHFRQAFQNILCYCLSGDAP